VANHHGASMLEWRKMPRGYTLDHNGYQADTWPVAAQGGGTVWYWTVLDVSSGRYLDGRNGSDGATSLDAACEAALAVCEAPGGVRDLKWSDAT